MKKHVLILDLKEDPKLIEEYIEYHQNVWPEILLSIKASGIKKMEIFHVANRLCMIVQVTDDFDFQRKSEMDQANPKVVEWEKLMDTYQNRLPFARPKEKWVLMEKIFES